MHYLAGAHDRHARDDRRDVSLGDHAILVEIVDIEHELHLLVELRAVNAKQARQEFF